jgi:murein DD-endopeptidase MepM/ murein hydrolase activator NlpD/cell wall-associated NlpC family hydrolase
MKDYFGKDANSVPKIGDFGKSTAGSDIKGAAKSAAAGAAKGASVGGLAGAAAGAAKAAAISLVKTKTGRKIGAGIVLAAATPAIAFIIAISMISGVGTSVASQNNNDHSAAFSAARAADIKDEEVAIYTEYGNRYGVPWEILASAAMVQKNTGSTGHGAYKITIDGAGEPVTNGKRLDYLSGQPGEYTTSKTDLEDLRKSTEYLARIIRDSFVGTVNNLPYNSLIIGSRISGSTDPKVPYRQIDQKNNDDIANAKRVSDAYHEALIRLPLENITRNADPIFEKARLLAMGQSSGAVCSILPVASGKWGNPFVAQTTSPFGARFDPITGAAVNHDGQDLAGLPQGTPFYSASDGTVLSAFGTGGPEGNGDGGHGIIVDAGGGVQLWYWHAADGTTKVRKGDKVATGQELAGVGTTGHSTGVHLHFQIMENGVAVEPVAFMAARGVKLGVDPIGQAGGSNTATPGTNWDISESMTATNADGDNIVLKANQLKNAEAIISIGRSLGVDDKGILVALITALQESKLLMYANSSAYPESLSYPHDADGSDHDSLGLFQQRPASGWGSVAELMDAVENAKRFYGGPQGPNGGSPPGLLDVLKSRPSLATAGPGEVAQAVQVSAAPDAYDKWVPVAQKIMSTVSGTSTPTSCIGNGSTDGTGDVTTGLKFDGDISAARQSIIDNAKSGLGGNYVWGGNDFRSWDCSGYFQWVYTKSGVEGVPRVDQWSAGKKTTSPKPGDLVVMLADKYDAKGQAINWSHVGIYAGTQNGEPMFYNALNPSEGTQLNSIASVGTDAEYFNLFND